MVLLRPWGAWRSVLVTGSGSPSCRERLCWKKGLVNGDLRPPGVRVGPAPLALGVKLALGAGSLALTQALPQRRPDSFCLSPHSWISV